MAFFVDKALMKKGMRPTEFDEAIASEICDQISLGARIRDIVSDNAMPDMRTIDKWRAENPVFYRQYLVALQNRAEMLVDEIVDIEYDMREKVINPTEAKIMIDNRKWLAERFFPEMFGSKNNLEHKHTIIEEKAIYGETEINALKRLGIDL